MKFEQYYSEVEIPQSKEFDGKPHASIQWKGTNVCADVRCPCGSNCHVDAEFFFNYECPDCHKRYAVGTYVKLIELTADQCGYWDGGFQVGET